MFAISNIWRKDNLDTKFDFTIESQNCPSSE